MDTLGKNILLIAKPFGLTSFAVTNRVKKILHAKKAGHIGTLDPMATGLMVVALNSATRFIPYIDTDEKRYVIQIQFGIETDTDDITGSIINQKDSVVTIEEIKRVLDQFIGIIEQIPPNYSAKKFKGKPFYKYARQGEIIKKKPCQVEIHKMSIVSFHSNKLVLDITCSKGTYMRSIARDMGRALGTFATLSAITRLSIGRFCISDAATFGRIKSGDFDKGFLTADQAIDLPVLFVKEASRFKNGLDITVDKVVVRDEKGVFIGIGRHKDGKVHPEKVLNEDI